MTIDLGICKFDLCDSVIDLILEYFLNFRLNAAGDLISIPMRYSRQRSVLVTGCVSYDCPREIHHVEEPRSINQYLGVLQNVAAV